MPKVAETLTLVPYVLRWARERASLAPKDLAAKLKVPVQEVLDWEKVGRIGMPKVRKLAHQTLTPLGFLFLKSPPDDPLPVADFRTVGKVAPRRPSPELLATVTAMLMRQDWFSEELKRDEFPALKYVKSHDAQVSSPEAVAEGMREAFQLDRGWQVGMNNVAAREHLYVSMENAGMLPVINGIVGNNTHRPLDPADFRGFALVDNRAPLVFVNGNDAYAAQIFTLAHEAAHVFIGKSGVSLCRPLEKTQAVEAFCNKAAASFLVPPELLTKQWTDLPYDAARIGRVAKSFCVSKPVIAIRARDLRLLTPRQFRDFYTAYKKSEQAVGKRHRLVGGNFWSTQRYRIGERFGDAVVHAVLSREMLYSDALELTGLKGSTFDKFVEMRRMQL